MKYKPKHQIKTASDLKFRYRQANPEGVFFSWHSMRVFGDTMRNYGVRQPVEVTTRQGSTVLAYELYRRRPVDLGLNHSAWFHAETFQLVYPVAR